MSDISSDFVHLHLHTQFSLLDGAIRFNDLFNKAKEFNMKSVAMTDHGTMFGAVEFFQKAQKNDIKPIIGCECYLTPRTIKDKTPLDNKGSRHIVLLAKDMEGYKNLCKLATISQLEGFYYRPKIDKPILEEHSKGLICLSACLKGEIPQLILEGKMDEALKSANYYSRLFGEDNFYLEVQHNDIDIQETVNQGLLEIHNQTSIPLVATNDCHYMNREDAEAHEVLLCIQTGQTMNDPKRFKFSTDTLYFKSPDVMKETLGSYPDAISNTLDIAARCDVDLNFTGYHFPKFESDSGQTPEEMFDELGRKGFENRWKQIIEKNPEADRAVYDKRLDYEIKIVNDMGFPGYFLIVADFINYAKDNGIPVGPGRGSAAGSLVSYALDITDLDPIEHGLIFERFLNPERISMPDIDTDFCIRGREDVYKYVVQRYGGPEFVGQIITFGQMKTKAVIRDVGRALDIPLKEVDYIAKLVPDVLGIKLDDAIKQEPKFQDLMDENPDVNHLIKICRVLEGLTRHASTHACGVVIGETELVDYSPLYRGKNDEVVTQYSKDFVEHVGLVKFDFLGLRNLTVIEDCLVLIKKQGKERPDINKIDYFDQKSFDLLCDGNTTGVFQLESSGMKELLRKLKPNRFADVIALVALYRPGPLESGMVDDYVERKHGRQTVVYDIPLLEPILEETYGVILYQEQVMKIAVDLAGYSMGQADVLRKAMGKKKPELMAEHRGKFVDGCETKHGIDRKLSEDLFNNIEKFAGYGFNKSHSAAYAVIAYQTAWLKAHYPVELMAALLSSENNSADAVVKFITECQANDIVILPPDINSSDKSFSVTDKEIRYGLSAVKNVGDAAIDSIVETRSKGDTYESIFDFCEKVDLRKVNKRVVESLIQCGAFDSTGAKRSQLMAAVEDSLDHGQRVQKDKNDPQMGLFDMLEDSSSISINAPELIKMDEWDDKELLDMEKEVLGFYVSGHPLDKYSATLKKFTGDGFLSLKERGNGEAVRIGGLIKEVKAIRTKKGDSMAFVLLEDFHSTLEAVVFPEAYETYSHMLLVDNPVIIEGELQIKENSESVIAQKIVRLDNAEETFTGCVVIKMNTKEGDRSKILHLKDLIQKFPGSSRTMLHMDIDGKARTEIELPDKFNVKSDDDFIKEANSLFGENSVMTTSLPVKLKMRKKKVWQKN